MYSDGFQIVCHQITFQLINFYYAQTIVTKKKKRERKATIAKRKKLKLSTRFKQKEKVEKRISYRPKC